MVFRSKGFFRFVTRFSQVPAIVHQSAEFGILIVCGTSCFKGMTTLVLYAGGCPTPEERASNKETLQVVLISARTLILTYLHQFSNIS